MITNPYNNDFEIWATGERNVDLDTISLYHLLEILKEYNKLNK